MKEAETVVWLASSTDMEGITCKYFHDKKEIKSAPLSHDQQVQRKLWEISEKLVGLN